MPKKKKGSIANGNRTSMEKVLLSDRSKVFAKGEKKAFMTESRGHRVFSPRKKTAKEEREDEDWIFIE